MSRASNLPGTKRLDYNMFSGNIMVCRCQSSRLYQKNVLASLLDFTYIGTNEFVSVQVLSEVIRRSLNHGREIAVSGFYVQYDWHCRCSGEKWLALSNNNKHTLNCIVLFVTITHFAIH
jgi:hypothetical protein